MYIISMSDSEILLTLEQVAEARERRLVAMHLQVMECNQLDADDIAMFEMFERERWSDARRRAYITDRAKRAASRTAAD